MRWIDLRWYQCLGKHSNLSWLTPSRVPGMLSLTILCDQWKIATSCVLWSWLIETEASNWWDGSTVVCSNQERLPIGYLHCQGLQSRLLSLLLYVVGEPVKSHGSYTEERRFEIRKYHLLSSFKDTFGMPKTTIFNITKRQPSGEPAWGRGNRKGAGRLLSMKSLHPQMLPDTFSERQD